MNSSIITEVCSLSGCTEDQVKSKSRKREIIRARQILLSYNHLILFKNQEQSAIEFNKSHCAVIHSIKTVQKDYSTDKNYRELFGEFLESNDKILKHKFHFYGSNVTQFKPNESFYEQDKPEIPF